MIYIVILKKLIYKSNFWNITINMGSNFSAMDMNLFHMNQMEKKPQKVIRRNKNSNNIQFLSITRSLSENDLSRYSNG